MSRVFIPDPVEGASFRFEVTKEDVRDLADLHHQALMERIREGYLRGADGTLRRGRIFGLTSRASSTPDGDVSVEAGSALAGLGNNAAEQMIVVPADVVMSILDDSSINIDPVGGGPGITPKEITQNYVVFAGRISGSPAASRANLTAIQTGDLMEEFVGAGYNIITGIERSDTEDQKVFITETIQMVPDSSPATNATIKKPGVATLGANPRIDLITVKAIEVRGKSDLTDAEEPRNIYDQTKDPGDADYIKSEMVRPRIVSTYAMVHRAGTPNAAPTRPAFPTGEIPLSEIAVSATATVISTGDITNLINPVVSLQGHRDWSGDAGAVDDAGLARDGWDHADGGLRKRHWPPVGTTAFIDLCTLLAQCTTKLSSLFPSMLMLHKWAQHSGDMSVVNPSVSGIAPWTEILDKDTLTNHDNSVAVILWMAYMFDNNGDSKRLYVYPTVNGLPVDNMVSFTRGDVSVDNFGHTTFGIAFIPQRVLGVGISAVGGTNPGIDNTVSSVLLGVDVTNSSATDPALLGAYSFTIGD